MGNGADLGIGASAGPNSIGTLFGVVDRRRAVLRRGGLLFHDAILHANGSARIGGRRDKGYLVRRPADRGADAPAILGALVPGLDRVADRDMAQYAGGDVLPDGLDLGPARELDGSDALFAGDGGIADGAEHVAHRGLAMGIEHARADQPRQVHGFGIEAQALDIVAVQILPLDRSARGPDDVHGAGVGVDGAGRETRAAGEGVELRTERQICTSEHRRRVSHDRPHWVAPVAMPRNKGPARRRGPCRRRSRHPPARHRSRARRWPGSGI